MTGAECKAVLKALGEDTRMRILPLLFNEPLSVTEISERLKVSQYNASRHLRVLREAGLLDIEHKGRQHLYSLSRKFKSAAASNHNILDLGCCTFRLDQLSR